MLEWITYPPLGVIVGIIAGLLGIGGGVVIVPILVFVFTAQGFSAHQKVGKEVPKRGKGIHTHQLAISE